MKLVLLELLIVVVATRAVLALLGMATPAWPNPLWVLLAFVAFGAVMAIVATELRKRSSVRAELPLLVPPHIPMERIGPFNEAALVVRYGLSGRPDIHLN